MERLVAKNVVVGAGAVGSAAAYHLARRGEPVALVEQFGLGHARGSSHGAARITRHSYADPDYARLMPAAFRSWRELEADAGRSFYVRTGGVSFGPPGVGYVDRVAANLAELDVPHRKMSGADWNDVQPAFALPADYEAVFEPDAGMLAAAKAIEAQVELARRGPDTRILTERPIRRIDLEGERPVVVSDGLSIEAERVILAAGPWTGRLAPGSAAALRPTRQRVLYFRPVNPAPYQVGRFPTFIYMGATEDDAFYGMPEFLAPGMKLGRHGGPDTDPDRQDSTVPDDYVALLRTFLAKHIPGLAGAEIVATETCIYTVAPGERFLVDFHPERRDVIVASPCSGHGFKFSNLVGRVLADMAATGEADPAYAAWTRLP
ncbi:N-methyl-L-tryptophan oxidase [Paludisphaera mucosa]|uniref:N-methyl-L-tryptophan oxidase n=1 Tax=Paludisphaera mucosa TaxID=3030827 RepID=A0ABT6FGN5_9BACT|nr:N-methyl-L-tryptophan oxidase [Paludisphaera mucosa]MDG3006741.1 N-methyl-L-tryptophan oxidase [Paludisphaera mucosa]